MNCSIEDIILQHDKRGMTLLRDYLPLDYCKNAANTLLNLKGVVFIVSGFYILSAHQPETDGPPSAILLGEILEDLGLKVYFITDKYAQKLFVPFVDEEKLIEFPITSDEVATVFARDLIETYNPVGIISIERCGRAQDGKYYNMKGQDITAYNAAVDALFFNHHHTISIGDGGNEIGMGNLEQFLIQEKITLNPCMIKSRHLIISSVSNYGVYGLITAMSLIRNEPLLPAWEHQKKLIVQMNHLGAVDGMTGQSDGGVDGFSLGEQEQVYTQLLEMIQQATKSDK